MTPIGNKAKLFVIFSLLTLKILVIYFSFSPRKFDIVYPTPGPILWLHLNRQTIGNEILGRIILSISFLE